MVIPRDTPKQDAKVVNLRVKKTIQEISQMIEKKLNAPAAKADQAVTPESKNPPLNKRGIFCKLINWSPELKINPDQVFDWYQNFLSGNQ